MDSNVTKYEVLISTALRAQLDVQRKEKALIKAKSILEERMKTLIQDCQRCFDVAVERYNAAESSYKIFDQKIGVLLDRGTVSAFFRLGFNDGLGRRREPDESFSDEDHEMALAVLKPFVDEELKKQGIPFTFRSFSVPIDYYPK